MSEDVADITRTDAVHHSVGKFGLLLCLQPKLLFAHSSCAASHSRSAFFERHNELLKYPVIIMNYMTDWQVEGSNAAGSG